MLYRNFGGCAPTGLMTLAIDNSPIAQTFDDMASYAATATT